MARIVKTIMRNIIHSYISSEITNGEYIDYIKINKTDLKEIVLTFERSIIILAGIPYLECEEGFKGVMIL